jgi:translation initiation factor 3 subunit D
VDCTGYSRQGGYDEAWVSFPPIYEPLPILTHLSFVSRVNPKSPETHVILGVLGYKPREFAAQMNLNLANGWGIVRTIVDMVLKMDDGKFVLIKDPNKNMLRLYSVPSDTFDDEEGVLEKHDEDEAEE